MGVSEATHRRRSTADPATPGTAPAAEIHAILRQVLSGRDGPHALHEPELTAVERAHVNKALDEGYVSYAGRQVGQFEAALAAACGARRAVALCSGTAALQMALHGLGAGPDHEVLCPALTFVATPNAIHHAGAVPHFVDCTEDDLGVDPLRLGEHLHRVAQRTPSGTFNRNTGSRISTLIAVHVLGHVGRLAELAAIARDWRLTLVEDAAEAMGSRDADDLVFRAGNAATLSFNGNKIVTTGGGGAMLTDDVELADRIWHLTTTAKTPHAWRFWHDAAGHNLRLANLNAALGLAQMQRLHDLLARKRTLADRYRAAFTGATHWRLIEEPPGHASNFWLNAVRLKTPDQALLDQSLARLHQDGFLCRPLWTPAHQLPMYRDAPRDALPVTEALAAQVICLPSSPKLVGESGRG